MEKPNVNLTPIIHYLREKCGKETYAKQLDAIQEYLHVPPTTGDKVDVEEVLCRSILETARRHLEALYPKAEPVMFVELAVRVATEVREWRTLGLRHYGVDTPTVADLVTEIDNRLTRPDESSS